METETLNRLEAVPEKTLTLFRNSMTYGYERVYTTECNVFDNELRQAFFIEIYYKRPFLEEKLQAFCTASGGGLGIVMGVQGSGKSTIVQFVQKEVDGQHYPFLVIDFISFYTEKLSYTPVESWRKVIENCLKEQITSQFFDEERIDSFFLHFLYEDKQTRVIFREELDEIRRLYNYDIFRQEGVVVETEKQWFRRNLPNHPDLANSISSKLTLEHYFKAARLKTQHEIKQFVIVLDNIDRVARHHQCDLYAVAEDIRATHTTTANIVITTRKDTCHPPQEVCNLNQAPVVQIGVYDAHPSDEGMLTSRHFQEILNRRIEAFRKVARGERFVEQLAEISKSMGEMYAEIVLIDVANQSIRDALRYHCDFVEYLVTEYAPGVICDRLPEKREVGSFLISCLYGWIASHGSVLSKQCLNLVELLDECKQRKFLNIAGCDITYLLLVCLLNYHRRNRSNPTVRDLFSRFKMLDYDNKMLLKALFDLWNLRTHEFGHVLSIYQKNLPKSAEDITKQAEVELNYRGEILIEKISVSFTFNNRLLFDKGGEFYPNKAKSGIDHYYEIKYLPKHLEHSVLFLFNLAFLHSMELYKICIRSSSKQWFDDYARDFCIGQDLQLKRIIDSHCYYLQRTIDLHANQEGNNWRENLERGIMQLNFLSELYDIQVKSLDHEKHKFNMIVDFVKVHQDIVKEALKLPTNAGQVFNTADYKTEISSTQ